MALHVPWLAEVRVKGNLGMMLSLCLIMIYNDGVSAL